MSLLLHFSRRYPEKHYTITLPEVKDMKEACKISADVINAHEAYSDLYINQLDKTIAGISDEHGIAITALKEDGKTWIDKTGNIVQITRKIEDDILIPNEWLNNSGKELKKNEEIEENEENEEIGFEEYKAARQIEQGRHTLAITGYAIQAAEKIGMQKEDINKLTEAMLEIFKSKNTMKYEEAKEKVREISTPDHIPIYKFSDFATEKEYCMIMGYIIQTLQETNIESIIYNKLKEKLKKEKVKDAIYIYTEHKEYINGEY